MVRRSSTPLSRDAIVDAAIELIERDGPAALSMRRLGAALGVEAMSLYHHIDGREALLVAIEERLLEPLAELPLDQPWRATCATFARGLREIARSRPATFRLIGLQPFDTAASLRAVERLLARFIAEGFAPAAALAAYRTVSSFARGYALAEATGFTVDAAAPAGRRRLRALPADSFPILHGRIRELATLDAEQGFERGLAALIDGLPAPEEGR
jgi:AcrR family transcriptional regulator